MAPEKALKAAVIAHLNYGMYDIAAELLTIASAEVAARYAEALAGPGLTTAA